MTLRECMEVEEHPREEIKIIGPVMWVCLGAAVGSALVGIYLWMTM